MTLKTLKEKADVEGIRSLITDAVRRSICDMDEVAIWSRALDATDVQRIYNGSSTSGKAANLFSTGLSNGLVYWNRMGD